ncbi:hypothetical protein EVAR_39341_1 [Eumeta japonica]|uniref:Uncharacterized protein n=1 Tax=Eumeta variegata TaxID=151549 RepID=A0A4C1WP79_EUMVA|nr:hypothetical protein EVAR_39341_1 [Eumeta japonica]
MRRRGLAVWLALAAHLLTAKEIFSYTQAGSIQSTDARRDSNRARNKTELKRQQSGKNVGDIGTHLRQVGRRGGETGVREGADLLKGFLGCSPGPRGYKGPPSPIENNRRYLL